MELHYYVLIEIIDYKVLQRQLTELEKKMHLLSQSESEELAKLRDNNSNKIRNFMKANRNI